MSANDPCDNPPSLVCPICAEAMELISIAPNCQSVVYGYLCSSDGSRLSWQPPNPLKPTRYQSTKASRPPQQPLRA